MCEMKNEFSKSVPFWRILTKCIGTAVTLTILIVYRGLFFGESLLEGVKTDVPLEHARPAVFAVLVLLTLASLADGLAASYGKHAGDEKKTVFSSPLTAVISLTCIFLNSVVSFYVIELINNYYLLQMKTKYLWLGFGITFALYLILVFALNSLKLGMCIGNVTFLVWGMVNYFVQQFRGIPFQWIDFASMRTGMSVSGNYRYTPTWQMIAGIAVTGALCGFYLHRKTNKLFRNVPGRVLSRAAAAVLLFLFYTTIFRTDFLADTGIWLRDWQPWYTYRLFGMESGFFAFAKASFPKEPDGYSSAEVSSIIEESRSSAQEAAGEGDIPENIIVVMNESFSDLRIYPYFKTNRELMPFYDSLTENVQKGKLMVSVKGGTTANTEYEFLTGNSCVLSPPTVVYNSFIKQSQFSVARALKAQGYEVMALHPYGPHGWNRDVVYPRMGFDTFLTIQNSFQDAERVRGFVSDRGDYEEVIRQVEQKADGQKLFLFNITMQNHSAYRNESYVSDVDVTGFHGKNEGQAEQYCSLIRLSDEALSELIGYFSKSDQKTLILFFGDHQPEIGDDFWSYCFGKDLDDLTFEEQQNEYVTRWMIWANYDIPEKEDLTLSANYLAPYLLSLTGLKLTDYQQFLLQQRDTIPAMNAFGYLGTDGSQHQWDTDMTSDEAAERLRRYKCLIYNELTAGSGRDASFFGIEQ